MCEALPSKRCFKCGEVKILSDFYKHPRMADGHVNKCKECNKADVTENRQTNLKKVQEYDRKRRKKCYVSEDRWLEILANSYAYVKAYREEYPKKYAAHIATGKAIQTGRLVKGSCCVCGKSEVHAHHVDYNFPLDVIWLCPEHHYQWHAENGEGLNGV